MKKFSYFLYSFNFIYLSVPKTLLDYTVQEHNWHREGGGEIYPAVFWELKRHAPNLAKTALVLLIFGGWISHLKMLFYENLGEKISSEIFSCGAFVSCVVDKMFIEVPLSNKTSPAMKNSWLCPLTVKFLAYLWVLKNNW